MKKIRDIIISMEEPVDNSVGWLLPVGDGTFKFKVYSFNGWTDIALGTQGQKGDKRDTGEQGSQGEQGPAGADGKSLTAIELTTNAEGALTGGTATLSDKSTIQITVTQS